MEAVERAQIALYKDARAGRASIGNRAMVRTKSLEIATKIEKVIQDHSHLPKGSVPRTPSYVISRFLLSLEEEPASLLEAQLEKWKLLPLEIQDALVSAVAKATNCSTEKGRGKIEAYPGTLLLLKDASGLNPLEMLLDRMEKQTKYQEELRTIKETVEREGDTSVVLKSPYFGALCHSVWYYNGGKDDPHFGSLTYGEDKIRENPKILSDYLDEMIRDLDKIDVSDMNFVRLSFGMRQDVGIWSHVAEKFLDQYLADCKSDTTSILRFLELGGNTADKVAKTIHTLAIANSDDRFKIALACVKTSDIAAESVAYLVDKLDIKNPAHRLALARLLCEKGKKAAIAVAKKIADFDIENLAHRLELARSLCAKGRMAAIAVAEHIDEFGIKPADRLELARSLCEKGEWGAKAVAENLTKFGIKPADRLELAKSLCEKGEWGPMIVAEHIDNFDIKDPADRLALARSLCEKGEGWGAKAVAKHLPKFDLKAADRLGLARLICEKGQWGAIIVAEYIAHFRIEKPADRLALARSLCEKGQWAAMEVAKKIADFDIKDPADRLALARSLCEKGEGWGAIVVAKKIADFDLPAGGRFKLAYALCNKFEMDKQWISERFLKSKTKAPPAERSNLEVLWDKMCNHRNTPNQIEILLSTGEVLETEALKSRLDALIGPKSPSYARLLIPLLVHLSQDIGETDFEKEITPIKKAISSLRHDIKSSETGLEVLLIQSLSILIHSPLPSDTKWHIVSSLFSFVERKNATNLKKALSSIAVLSHFGFLETVPAIGFFGSAFTIDDLEELVVKQIMQNMFKGVALDETQKRAIKDNYLKLTSSQRSPFGLEKYASSIVHVGEEPLTLAMQRFFLSLLEGKFKDARYDSTKSPHLEKLAKEFPTIWEKWKGGEKPSIKDIHAVAVSSHGASISEEEANGQWLQEKLIADKHLNLDTYPLLNGYLEMGTVPAEKSDTLDYKMAHLCHLLSPSTSAAAASAAGATSGGMSRDKTLELLQALKDAVSKDGTLKGSQWESDIEDRIKALTPAEKRGALEGMVTDEWQDLFLSGTEVLGSCQNIAGNVTYNKCLLSYCMDGKIQIAAVKDAKTGKIRSRALLKLLFVDGKPALFMERVYPRPCPDNEVECLTHLAKKMAAQIGVELYSLNKELNLGETGLLISYGTPVPYEYEDAGVRFSSEGGYSFIAKKVA